MKSFDDWFNQQEGYHLKSERFFGDVDYYAYTKMAGLDQQAKEIGQDLIKWLEAAFNAGVNSEKENKQNSES